MATDCSSHGFFPLAEDLISLEPEHLLILWFLAIIAIGCSSYLFLAWRLALTCQSQLLHSFSQAMLKEIFLIHCLSVLKKKPTWSPNGCQKTILYHKKGFLNVQGKFQFLCKCQTLKSFPSLFIRFVLQVSFFQQASSKWSLCKVGVKLVP